MTMDAFGRRGARDERSFTMDERQLHEFRREPDPEYAGRLRERLRRHERASALRWRPALGAAVAAAVVASLFLFPSVRVSAQAMLDMFRVRKFAAVEFDPVRMEKLENSEMGNPMMMLGSPEVLQEPGEPQTVATPEAAGAVAGIDVRTPSELPGGLALMKVWVEGAGAVRFTADATRLRSLLEALEIRDLEVPHAIDGKVVTVRKPQVVYQEFKSASRRAVLIQAKSPEVSLPAGANLPQLAEIGMRILGVEASQARRLSLSVDWNTTLLVPVPQNASSFRGVQIRGNPGLIVTSSGKGRPGEGEGRPREGERRKEGAIVMWTEADRVFAVAGDLTDLEMMRIAEAVR